MAGEGEGEGAGNVRLGLVSFKALRQMSLRELEWLIEHAKRGSVKLGAIREVLSRTDPPPKPGDEQPGPVTINVAIVSTGRAGLPTQGNGVAIRIGRGTGSST
jgi:hypothetical protein